MASERAFLRNLMGFRFKLKPDLSCLNLGLALGSGKWVFGVRSEVQVCQILLKPNLNQTSVTLNETNQNLFTCSGLSLGEITYLQVAVHSLSLLITDCRFVPCQCKPMYLLSLYIILAINAFQTSTTRRYSPWVKQ